MSDEPINMLPQFLDVQSWLLELGNRWDNKLLEVTHTAINKTSEHFNIPYKQVEELVTRRELAKIEGEVSIVTFYFEFLRKIRDSNL